MDKNTVFIMPKRQFIGESRELNNQIIYCNYCNKEKFMQIWIYADSISYLLIKSKQ